MTYKRESPKSPAVAAITTRTSCRPKYTTFGAHLHPTQLAASQLRCRYTASRRDSLLLQGPCTRSSTLKCHDHSAPPLLTRTPHPTTMHSPNRTFPPYQILRKHKRKKISRQVLREWQVDLSPHAGAPLAKMSTNKRATKTLRRKDTR